MAENGKVTKLAPWDTPAAPQDDGPVGSDRHLVALLIDHAHRYPRDIARALKDTTALVLTDDETAARSMYALPARRGSEENKPIEGPSIRFAEVLAHTWGNLHVSGREVDQDESFVWARGTAVDLQTLTLWEFDISRPIRGRNGRYPDSLVAQTATAACAIAVRNAVLRVVPSPVWWPIYQSCREAAMGSEKDLPQRRQAAVGYFADLGVPEAQILAFLGVPDLKAVTRVHVARLRGLATALRDNETTLEEAFADVKVVSMPQRVESKPNPGEAPSVLPSPNLAVGASVPAPPPPRARLQLQIVKIEEAQNGADPFWKIYLHDPTTPEDTRHPVITYDVALAAAAGKALKEKRTIAEVACHVEHGFTYLDELVLAP